MGNELGIIPLVTLLTAFGTLVVAVILIIQVRVSIRSQKDAHQSVEDSKKSYEIDILVKLGENLQKEKMILIAGNIANDEPIMIENGGTFSEYDLMRYLTIFQNVYHFTQMKILEPINVYTQFGNYLIGISKNEEIRNYIKLAQENQDSRTWEGIYTLAKQMQKYFDQRQNPSST